jgi:hypothetical protein
MEERNECSVSVGKREGKNYGRLMGRMEYNIKMELNKNGRDWTRLIWLRIGTSSGLF